MSSYEELLVDKYKSSGILIDANLLLLFFVGSFDMRLVGDGKYKKLSSYTVEDYRLLVRLKSVFRASFTTPHVLTEVSNLANDLPETTRKECFKTFCQTLEEIEELEVPSYKAARRAEFPYLGLTDSALAQMAERYLIVTSDGRLVSKLTQSGLDALNFNHLRFSSAATQYDQF